MISAKYPLVKCDQHGGFSQEPCYMVCIHLLRNKEPIFHVKAPTEELIGVLACRKCMERNSLDSRDWKVLCSRCAGAEFADRMLS